MSQSQNFSQFPGGAASQGMAGPPRVENLIPMTIVQLNKIEEVDGQKCLFGKPIGTILMVGLVTGVQPGETYHKYQVQDCTGEMQVTQWHNRAGDDDEAAAPEPHPEGNYIRLMGKHDAYQSKATFTAHQIRPCQEYDEVTRHYLACNVAYLEMMADGNTAASGQAAQSAVPQTTSGGPGNFANGASDSNHENLSPEHAEVYKLIQQMQQNNENGADLRELTKQLGRDVSSSVSHLMDEGQIYDTVDANWVKTTDA